MFRYMYIYIYIYYIYIKYTYVYAKNTIQKFKYSEFHVNYFKIFSLITTHSTDVKKWLQCKGIFLSDVT